jgi:hypothetical protein
MNTEETIMGRPDLPQLDDVDFGLTRDALHEYSRVLGGWLKSSRPKRKHWWHASLRPALTGLTSSVIHADPDFELTLNLRQSQFCVQTSTGEEFTVPLQGQPASEIAGLVSDFLLGNGLSQQYFPDSADHYSTNAHAGYSAEHAYKLALVLNFVSATMEELRAGIHEETSPIQLWPHHFDLSMVWLPGEKISGQDPLNEEYSDKQMNFGFAFGDGGIPEPYFYITAYPFPDEFPGLDLPTGTSWQSDSFSGAVLTYKTLFESSDPNGYLLDLWNSLLLAGRKHMLSATN